MKKIKLEPDIYTKIKFEKVEQEYKWIIYNLCMDIKKYEKIINHKEAIIRKLKEENKKFKED